MSKSALLRRLPRLVKTLLVGAILSRLAFSMTTPFLTIFLIRHTHLNIADVGLVVGGASVAGMFGGFIAGALTDRFGRKPILISTLYTWVIVFALFAVVRVPWVLVFLTLLNGACRSIFDPVSQVMMSDMTPIEERHQVFSMRYTAANIGYSAGPIIGAWLGLTGGSGAFVFSGITFAIYAILLHTMMVYNGSTVEGHSMTQHASLITVIKVVLSDKSLLYYLFGGMLVRSAYEQVNTNLSVHFQQQVFHGLELFAVTLSTNAVVVVLFQIPVSKWAEKKSLLVNVFSGNVCYAIGLIGLAFTRNWTLGIISMVIFTFGEILSFPAGTLFIDKIAPENMRGAYYGTKNILDLGKFFGPWLGGLIMVSWGGTVMLSLTAAIVLVSTFFYRVGLNRHRVGQPFGYTLNH